jgi:uncharacterized OsmC-like protein
MSSASAQVVSEFEITLEQLDNYEFRVRFDKEHHPELMLDEPAPLGGDRAPNAARLLAAAIGNCLSASLLFCAGKSRVPLGPVRTRVRATVARNERGRLRIAGVQVEIDPQFAAGGADKAARCLEVFEDYCLVTQSVRKGIPIEVTVKS